MPKPIVNLDELQFDDVEENGYYTSKRALFSAGIGARKLGYNLTELAPEGTVSISLPPRRRGDVPHRRR
jgi:hypothetical protein